jgi:di/tricarboxylate transporter
MKPIWYFVGLLLLTMGAIVLVSGVYQAINPPSQSTVLGELHPSLWWGAIMTLAGGIFLVTNRNKTVE